MAHSPESENEKLVMSADVGTTSIRVHLYDKKGKQRSSSVQKVTLIYPEPGRVEIDPEELWKSFHTACQDALKDGGFDIGQVACLGISTQRNTFTLWEKDTGKPLFNLITWQDLRAAQLVKRWNESLTWRGLAVGAKAMHFVTRQKRYLAGSVLRFISPQVTMRLLHVLQNNPEVNRRARKGEICYGDIGTWFLWKLTKGKEYATDYSCASGSGMFDPFLLKWSSFVCGTVNIPMNILPPVKDTSHNFGETDKDIFGRCIPITSIVGDQSAAMFGQCCFSAGDVKLTMGTGTFLDVNTGRKPHTSMKGIYPLVAWSIAGVPTYMAEGASNDTGVVIEWARRMDLFDDVTKTAEIARSVPDSGGVCFVPAFSGLQAPINDETACTLLLGMTPTTGKAHVLRAVLESLAFRVKLLYETVVEESPITLKEMKVDGGVSNNEFVMSLISEICGIRLHRPEHTEMACIGAAYLAGLRVQFWKDLDELKTIHETDEVFSPQGLWPQYRSRVADWERAVHRAKLWYSTSPEHIPPKNAGVANSRGDADENHVGEASGDN